MAVLNYRKIFVRSVKKGKMVLGSMLAALSFGSIWLYGEVWLKLLLIPITVLKVFG
jgi:hypothetical protein